MRKLFPITDHEAFCHQSRSRRLTFKTNNLWSKIRLWWVSVTNFPNLRYDCYIYKSLDRLKAQLKRKNNVISTKIIDENYPDRAKYIETIRQIEIQIEEFNPTFH